jgi:hypothetical protein
MVLIAIAQHANGVTRPQLSVLTGYKERTRNDYISRLRARGLVDLAGDRVVATQGGIDTLGADYEPLPTGDALRAHAAIICGEYPHAVPRAQVGALSGFKERTRNDYIARLRARELITIAGADVRAADTLFE